jgi:hypothetical protein
VTATENQILTWEQCARLCKSEAPQPDVEITFVWGQTDHVLRRFFQTSSLPNLRRIHIESPTWDGGPGQLFLGLAARGRQLEEMTVTTSLDLAKTRVVTFAVHFEHDGNPVTEYSLAAQPLFEGELDAARIALGLPQTRPIISVAGRPRGS